MQRGSVYSDTIAHYRKHLPTLKLEASEEALIQNLCQLLRSD